MAKWTKKNCDQYDAIMDSNLERGMKQERAKEVAARTVNKHRREQGQTPNKTTQGTGNPNRGYEQRSKRELYNLARERNVGGRSKMSKAELIEALR